jgi:hypothetical protein
MTLSTLLTQAKASALTDEVKEGLTTLLSVAEANLQVFMQQQTVTPETTAAGINVLEREKRAELYSLAFFTFLGTLGAAQAPLEAQAVITWLSANNTGFIIDGALTAGTYPVTRSPGNPSGAAINVLYSE